MIRISDINLSFNKGTRDEVTALKNLSLEIGYGEFVTVIGTNGSGKSTLLNIIAGTLLPDSGSILINGREVARKHDFERAGYVARVFQNPFAGTAPQMSIAENLHLASQRGKTRWPFIGLTGTKIREYQQLLSGLEMNLEDRIRQPVGLLSGGQRQAITLLMAVMNKPDVLLLDEHTAALDPRSAAMISKLTSAWVEEGKLTTLMVTHSMNQALAMGSRILMMHQGSVIEDFRAEDRLHVTVDELHQRFLEIRKLEKLTPDWLQMLKEQYL